MSARTVEIVESLPADYPEIGSGSPPEFEASLVASVWQRIEGWIAWRFSERDVVFIVEGCGEWAPPLKPATIDTTEIWESDAWAAVTLRPSPLGGYVLDGDGPYRFSGTVGNADDPPAAVSEAARRLASYFVAVTEGGGTSATLGRVQSGELSLERSGPNWAARAIFQSGAADLLKPYRNLGAA